MLRIIDAKGSLPNSYEVWPFGLFEPGMIAELVHLQTPLGDNDFPKKRTWAGRSWGKGGIGIIDDIRTQIDDSTQGTNRITVWEDTFIGVTDCFEPKANYITDDLLGVSINGLLSSKKKDIQSSGVLARVKAKGILYKNRSVGYSTDFTQTKKLLTFEWLGQGLSKEIAERFTLVSLADIKQWLKSKSK